MAIKLSDLCPKERELLMQQAREEVEKENIEKDAVAMYAIKKKELINNTVNEITNVFNLKKETSIIKCRTNFVQMVNYLYMLNNATTNNNGKNIVKITTAKDWELYQSICKKVHECMMHCVKYK